VGLEPGKKPPFYFDNTSITIVDLSRKRPRLARQNDTCHLRDMGGE